ncbi:hypothetical protein MMC27_005980 [Xylographa pallens]|nr:hypothetical protein [Xylographa pallens]
MSPWLRSAVAALLVTILLLSTIQNVGFGNLKRWRTLPPHAAGGRASKVIVMGKLEAEDTSWVARDLPDWDNAVYVVDNTSAPLHTPVNKGREAMAYLTYVIDNYEALPDTVLFLHSHRDGEFRAWHVDNEAHDNVESVQALRLDYVAVAGYVNLRCGLLPGCNHEVQPFRSPPVDGLEVEHAMHDAWKAMFPGEALPHEIGVPCCAQFAVSKQQIRARPKTDYERYRNWIRETQLHDRTSGRVMEYLWHIIFGKEPVQYVEAVRRWRSATVMCMVVVEERRGGTGWCDDVGQSCGIDIWESRVRSEKRNEGVEGNDRERRPLFWRAECRAKAERDE